ncbi:hypothetical protein [Koleobacter methoxysyntrophicus]|nr:hypothetical protein [Koleobacter methoxysyntrophicus]
MIMYFAQDTASLLLNYSNSQSACLWLKAVDGGEPQRFTDV